MAVHPDDAAALLSSARHLLTGTARASEGNGASAEPASGPEIAIVSAYHRGQLVATGLGRGTTPAAATEQAARRASTDRRLLALHDTAGLRIELWLLAEQIIDRADFQLGLDSIGARGRTYRASVPLTRGLTSASNAVRALTGGRAPTSHRWQHFIETDTGPVELIRLRPPTPVVTRDVAQASADLACRRLLNVQSASGEYRYVDHAFARVKPEPLNIVRMAGTTYAMAMTADLASSPELAGRAAASAERGVGFLIGHAVPYADGWLIRQPSDATGQGPARSGAAALTLLAMQYGGLAETFRSQRRRLVDGLLALQDPNGRFRCSSHETVADPDGSSQDYFPGETMLALIHEAERGDGRCFAAVVAGFPAYVEHFRRRPSLAFALWQADAWWRVWRLIGGESGQAKAEPYADFVREIADFVLRRQLRGKDLPAGFAGGFAGRGRTPGISSACYVEAVAKAYAVTPDGPSRRRYRDAVRAGLRAVLGLQVDPVLTDLLPRPDESVGAFTRSLTDFGLRNDNDQHAITMLLDATRHAGLLSEPSTPPASA